MSQPLDGGADVGEQSAPDHIQELRAGRRIVRPAAYIGSFPVEGADQQQRSEFVHRELEKMRDYNRSKSVQLWVALSGIKVCDESGSCVHMAHALRRVSYANCNPDCCQFAFMAREPKTQVNLQYCHAFVTADAELAEELNNLVGDCFKLAYALQKQQEKKSKRQQQQQQQQAPPAPTPSSQRPSQPPAQSLPLAAGQSPAFTLAAARQQQQQQQQQPVIEKFRSSYGNPVIVLKECIDQSVTSSSSLPDANWPLTSSSSLSSSAPPPPPLPPVGDVVDSALAPSIGAAAGNNGVADAEPPPPLPMRYDSLRPSESGFGVGAVSADSLAPTDKDLTPASWYQADLPRDLALELLSEEEVGGFIVRDSSTHANCYALSVRVPKYDNASGYAHYLIQRTGRGVKLKGLAKEWPSLQALVCHLSVMPELLPCPLRLPRQQANPIYSDSAALGTGATNASDEQEQPCPYGLDLPPDEDYQRLSDFSSILAELKL